MGNLILFFVLNKDMVFNMMMFFVLVCGCNDCFVDVYSNLISKIMEFVNLVRYFFMLIFLVFDVFGFLCIVIFLFVI